MHTWGRVYADDGTYTWSKVSTDANGNNDQVMITALCQELKLNLGESPFYADRGIPAYRSVMTSIFPDYNSSLIQQRYAQYFAGLIITRDTTKTNPTYKVLVTTKSGAIITNSVAV
jgi:hypothetical protein